jgi:FixJ family two-component response regulator/DNA-binding HxlR family transcriptional regulator
MRILIVDDDPDFRSGLVGLLTDAGHRATGVSDPGQATAELEGNEFDVMFTDLRMRRRSGMDLLVLARKRWPRMQVVMLTGHATVESAVEALQEGAIDYVQKPYRADQIERVLELVSEQLALTRAGAKPLDPVRYARVLATEGGFEVLLIMPPPIPVTPDKVIGLPLDPENPFRIRDAVEGFAAPKEKAAVVLAAIEELLARHREEEISALLEAIRAALQGKGPLAVAYDPDKITATGALAVRASIVSADVHETLESLSNPLRRLVLRRLGEGPITFSQALEAAHIDDTSKIAFHLRKLTESGLVAHLPGERYRLTPRGKGALNILSSIDELDSGKLGSGNLAFPSKTPNLPAS